MKAKTNKNFLTILILIGAVGCSHRKEIDDLFQRANAAKDESNYYLAVIRNTLAWLLATCSDASVRNGKQAVEIARNACDLTKWGDWRYLDTLAAAYAETGDFESAIKFQKLAINLQNLVTNEDPNGLKPRLDLYQQQKPYHETLK
jgi:tetratricopeptide (TPR) repeat protein